MKMKYKYYLLIADVIILAVFSSAFGILHIKYPEQLIMIAASSFVICFAVLTITNRRIAKMARQDPPQPE